jgi:hypothetical protein
MQDAPSAQLILDYEVYYGVTPPQDSLSLLNVSKRFILFELCGLNSGII